ncbi:unnamed protein product [Arctogadus glacialis]
MWAERVSRSTLLSKRFCHLCSPEADLRPARHGEPGKELHHGPARRTLQDVFIPDRGAGVSATRADCERVRQSLGMALRGCQVVREMESRGARPPDMRAADSLAQTHRED